MKPRAFTKTEWIVVGVILTVLIALLIPSPQGIWDGGFELTIHLSKDNSVDENSLLFATCWFDGDAIRALQSPGIYEFGFRPPVPSDDGYPTIHVPATGRVGTLSKNGTYNHARFLVVEYQLLNEYNGDKRRKSFAIPDGRGARSISIQLP